MLGIKTKAQADLVGSTRSELAEQFEAGRVDDIPNGRSRGTVLLGTGGILARVAAILSYLFLWRGKVVDAEQGRLKNLLSPFSIPGIVAEVYKAPSWHDGEDCIVLDYSTTSFLAQKIRDEIKEIAPGLFLGLVFWGKRQVLNFSLDFGKK